jgi:hypothetical protein
MTAGDRLRVERRFAGSTVTYMHHGIDVGDGTVVHARPHDFARPLDGGSVVRTSHAEFAGGSAVFITHEPAASFPSDAIVARALSQVGRDGYCPVVDNCEHFATWCATGERSSRQVEIVVGRIGAAAKRVAAAFSARVAAGAAERVVLRTAVGTSLRLGLRSLVPAAIVAEGAALAAEWTAHQAGRSAAESRLAGESAGLTTNALSLALAVGVGGPAGAIAGAVAGAAIWAGGSLVFARWAQAAGDAAGSRDRLRDQSRER